MATAWVRESDSSFVIALRAHVAIERRDAVVRALDEELDQPSFAVHLPLGIGLAVREDERASAGTRPDEARL